MRIHDFPESVFTISRNAYSHAPEYAFTAGGLNRSSRIRPNRLFTADSGIVVYRAGHVSVAKIDETRERLIQILSET